MPKRSIVQKIIRFWKKLGPGLVTGASDDDPSGITTYSQAGAQFGLSTLWTALITFPLMAAVQEMCARIGMVTSKGLTGTLKEHYSKPILYLMLLFSFPAILMNIGANIAGMGAVGNMLFPSVNAGFFSVGFTVMLMGIFVFLPYRKFAALLKYLCVVLLVYLIVPFLYKQDFLSILKGTFIPNIAFTKEFVGILVAILGTTISPYLFFWQATMVSEDRNLKRKKIIVDKMVLDDLKQDVNFGMLFSNVIMFFIILTSGTVLSLRPLAGDSAYLLFAIGIIGTGLLAIPVLCGCLSYIVSETFGWEKGLNKKFHQAKAFYSITIISLLLGLLMNYVGISPVQALLWSAILYGITAPVLILIILNIANNKEVMGEFTNNNKSNFLGYTAFTLMSVAALTLIYLQFSGK
jgi:Mn2+/Fe2+ NRAMP family transporter